MLDSAELRTGPWPGATSQFACSRLFLAVEKSHRADATIRITPPGANLLRTQMADAKGRELWELPFLTGEELAVATVEAHGVGRTERRPLSQLIDPVGVTFPLAGPWDDLATHHVEHCCRWGESSEQIAGTWRAEGSVHVEWAPFLHDYWEPRDEREPPKHLIVVIAQQCSEWVLELCERPRRILRRERRHVAVNQAQELDDACIRWLSRQPGRRLVDRAGPRQHLLAVVREESFDTAENRVLRDFLRLSRIAARRYLTQFAGYTDSRRFYDVRLFLGRIEHLLHASPIARVPALVGPALRNYVLQFDPRYSRLWQWYERLRRQEDDRDDLSRWRHRTWAEYCELLLANECEQLRRPSGSFQRPVVIRREADHGRFLDSKWTAGPWSLRAGKPLELLRLVRQHALATHANATVRQLGTLAPDFVLTAGPVFDEARVRVCMPVWASFTPSDAHDTLAAHLRRAAATLAKLEPAGRAGLVLLPAPVSAPVTEVLSFESVAGLRVGLPESPALPHTRSHLTRILTALVAGDAR